ncbi:Arm DNA-binding domain-containing protein [Qipengyuania sp.]|uniref:Arm DNA-binding domain-containing protein n=1 Tax=Qipengyuania sp. TaxID=2004515 RepID=UPI0035C7D88F
MAVPSAIWAGRRRDIGLGTLTAVSLVDAREAGLSIRKKIAQGIDPVVERKQDWQVIPTVRKVAEMVHEERRKAWKNGKHHDQWIATLKCEVDVIELI